MPKTVLVIDDELLILDALSVVLRDMGQTVVTCSDPVAAADIAEKGNYDLIVCDLRMPGKNGAEVTEEILRRNPSARVLIATAFPGDPLAARALSAGALGLLKKPFEIFKIIEYLEG